MQLPESVHHGWNVRMYALRNVPPVMRMFWDSSPRSVSFSLTFRLITALLPLGALLITRLIINGVVTYVSHSHALPQHFWLLVVADFALAGLSVVLTRAVDYLDEVSAGLFTMHSLRIMTHAAELDLASYEDPNFYDQLERARVQAIDRVNMIRALGQSVVAISLAANMDLLKGHPWGISEAAFGDRDPNRLFQYEGFGAPGLALRRYSMQRCIVSPYSTFLCLGIETQAALKNLYRMKDRNWLGRYGFYESAEIKVNGRPGSTADRITRCWMAHHQGMILLAISNLLTCTTMHQRFQAVPMIAATERLLHEKMPAEIPVEETFAVPNLDLAPRAPVDLAPDSLVS